MRWALMMIRLAAACRNTSVSRTTGTAPEPMMSASTCPGPTEGSWSISPTISNAASSGVAFNSACINMTSTIDASSTTSRSQSRELSALRLNPPLFGIDLQEPVDRLGLDARRLGHALRRAAGGGAKQQSHAFGGEDLKDRIDDRRLADARAPR